MLGTSAREMLARVKDRNTAGLSWPESIRWTRLIAQGAASPAMRAKVDKALDELWASAEKRLKKQMKEEEK